MRLDRFFSADAQRRILEAVHAAEAESEAQIVPVVVERTAPYSETRFRGALLLAGAATLVALLLPIPVTAALLTLVQLCALGVGFVVAGLPPVVRLLVGRRALEQAAERRAMQAFHEHGLHRTARRNGVLLFAALFERRVVVLGDVAVDEKMGPEGWRATVAALTRGIRRGDPAGGFCDAVALCGLALAEHFPRSAPSTTHPNELDDQLRLDPH